MLSFLLGLSMVGSLGVSGCTADTPTVEPEGDPLLRAEAWKHLSTTWGEAREISEGKRGAYPFDTKGRDKFLKELAACDSDIDQLVATSQLSADEASLLKQELPRLTSRVQALRTKDMKMASCYEPTALPTTAKPEIDRLASRLPLLQKLAKAGVLHPPAVGKILESIERDITPLADENALKRLSLNEQTEARSLTAQARQQIQVIRNLIFTSALPQWNVITEAWREASPLAQSGMSTQRQRDHVKQSLADACKAANELGKAGSLSAAEVSLLVAEAARLEKVIYRNPPTDIQVTCYKMAMIPPARESLERLSQRLPLLQQLTTAGRLNPAVTEKILPAIEQDLKTLTNDQELQRLPQKEQTTARELASQVAYQLEQIHRSIKP